MDLASLLEKTQVNMKIHVHEHCIYSYIMVLKTTCIYKINTEKLALHYAIHYAPSGVLCT